MQVEIENLGMGLSNCIIRKRFNVGGAHEADIGSCLQGKFARAMYRMRYWKVRSFCPCFMTHELKRAEFSATRWREKINFFAKKGISPHEKTVAETLWPQRYDLTLCPCYMSSLFVPALWPHCIKLLYVLALCPTPSHHFLFPLHVPTYVPTFPLFMFPLFMFPLYVPINASVLQPKGFKRQSVQLHITGLWECPSLVDLSY